MIFNESIEVAENLGYGSPHFDIEVDEDGSLYLGVDAEYAVRLSEKGVAALKRACAIHDNILVDKGGL